MERVQRILLPTDFSEPSLTAFPRAERLARIHGARILLFHTVPPLPWPADLALGQGRLPTLNRVLQKDCEERLRTLRKEHLDPDIPVEIHVRSGSPVEQIRGFATDQAVDLIVLATRGHSPLKRFLVGSTAERIARVAPCSVLVVRQ